MKDISVIEFIGLPGSGKTTLSIELSSNTANSDNLLPNGRGHESWVYLALKRHALALLCIVIHPYFSFQSIYYILLSKQKTINDFRAVTVNLLYKRLSYHLFSKNAVQIVDDGILHSILLILLTSRNKWSNDAERNIENLVSQVVNNQFLIVYVKNDITKTLDRLQLRKYKDNKKIRFVTCEGMHISNILMRYEKMVHNISRKTDSNVLEINTERKSNRDICQVIVKNARNLYLIS